jgi:signal transduction histidine kinase
VPGDHRSEPPFDKECSIGPDERRRIARELHETSSQLLGALQLKLSQLEHLNHPEAPFIIGECKRALEQIRVQMRALDLDSD